MDMKFGNHSWGCPEAALMSAAFAQLSRWYGIPCDTIAGAADSKPLYNDVSVINDISAFELRSEISLRTLHASVHTIEIV